LLQKDTAAVVPVPKPVIHKKHKALRHDSTHVMDSFAVTHPVRDSLPRLFIGNWLADTFLYTKHPFYRFTDPVHYGVSLKSWEGKESLFYSLIVLLILFALIRNGFHRYLSDLFSIYFRTTIRQRQVKEQLIQSPLPSLLLNLYFLLSAGMFATVLLQNYELGHQFNFWLLFFYCVVALTAIYGAKYISLKFFGWIFQISDAIDSYIFIVFTTNKILGLALLPFVIILSFSAGVFNQVALTLSVIVVISFFLYRYFLSYVSVQKQMRISFFHFVLYFCAFEIAPLLLINKLLFTFLAEKT
jgi:hypothetical protein